MRVDEGLGWQFDFRKLHAITQHGYDVVPAIIQDSSTGQVLMLGYMNQAALEHTISIKEVVLFSTSRGQLWHKGAESGNRIQVNSIWINCEQNSFLIQGSPVQNGVCHTKDTQGRYRPTCYFRELLGWPPSLTNGDSPPRGKNQDN